MSDEWRVYMASLLYNKWVHVKEHAYNSLIKHKTDIFSLNILVIMT